MQDPFINIPKKDPIRQLGREPFILEVYTLNSAITVCRKTINSTVTFGGLNGYVSGILISS